MELTARTTNGEIITVDLAKEKGGAPGESSPSDSESQLEVVSLLRKDIERIIRSHSSSPSQAAIEICVKLDEHLELSGNGWFDNDDAVQLAIQAAEQEDD